MKLYFSVFLAVLFFVIFWLGRVTAPSNSDSDFSAQGVEFSSRKKAVHSSSEDDEGGGVAVFDLGVDDPENGLKELIKYDNSEPEEKLSKYSDFAAGYAVNDPLGALEWANTIDDLRLRSICRSTIFGSWLQNESVEHQSVLNELKNHLESGWASEYVRDAVSGLTGKDENMAIDWVSKNLGNDENLYFDSLDEILRTVGEDDPQKFLTLVEEYELRGGSADAYSRLVFGIASRKISSALEILDSSPSIGEDETQKIFSRITSTFFERNPDSLVDFVVEKSPTHWREIVSRGVDGWISRDSGHFLGWIEGQDAELREAVLLRESSVKELARKQPIKVFALLEENLADSPEKVASQKVAISRWGRDDPAASLEWLQEQDSDVQQNLIDSYVESLHAIGIEDHASYLWNSKLPEEIWKN